MREVDCIVVVVVVVVVCVGWEGGRRVLSEVEGAE